MFFQLLLQGRRDLLRRERSSDRSVGTGLQICGGIRGCLPTRFFRPGMLRRGEGAPPYAPHLSIAVGALHEAPAGSSHSGVIKKRALQKAEEWLEARMPPLRQQPRFRPFSCVLQHALAVDTLYHPKTQRWVTPKASRMK